jgi:hypothetical protein
MESLQNHYEKVHRMAFCEKCIEFKPDLLCDQVLYPFDRLH